MLNPISPLLIFDLDGTLIDSLPDLTHAANIMLKSYNFPALEEIQVRAMIGDGVKVLVKKLLLQALPKESDLPNELIEEATQRYMDYYSTHSTELTQLFPDTVETLKTLKAKGWSLAVCTNKPVKAAEIILSGLNISPYFSAICGGDSFSYRKPDPRHILGTIQKAGGNARSSVMVGDHFNDLYAARDAAIAGSIFAQWGYGNKEMEQQATLIAKNMRELPSCAQDILSSS